MKFSIHLQKVIGSGNAATLCGGTTHKNPHFDDLSKITSRLERVTCTDCKKIINKVPTIDTVVSAFANSMNN